MLTSRMKSGCDSWWSKVSPASSRIASTGSRCSTSSCCSRTADAGVGLLQDGEVELLLAAEVVVDHPLGGAGLVRDLVDARAGVARGRRTRGWPRRGCRHGCARRRGRRSGHRRLELRRCAATASSGRRPPSVGGRTDTRDWRPEPLDVVPSVRNSPAGTRRRLVAEPRATCRRPVGTGIGPSLTPALHEREADALGLRVPLPAPRPRRAAGLRPRRRRRPARRGPASPATTASTSPTRASSWSSPTSTSSPPTPRRSARSTRSSSDGDRPVGHNTDWSGFARGASTAACPRPRSDRVVLLGAGGAGAAVAHALLTLGAGAG